MAAGVTDFASFRFSTRDIPEPERLPEEIGRRLLRVEIESSSDLPLHAEASLRALPGLRTVRYAGSAVRLERTPAGVAAGDDSIAIIVNLGESGIVAQRGQAVALGAGDAVAIRHEEPPTVTLAQGSYVGLLMPRAALASRVRDLDEAIMRLIPRGTESLRVLLSYLRSVGDELALATPRLRRLVVSHVHDLVALALSPQRTTGEVSMSALRAARLQAALAQIAACFQDPELGVAAVAQRQGISPRYLQRLLETSGNCFTARVNELRLQRALALLGEPGPRRIADIALEAGFSDISHFNRLFRARFGDTPGSVRARARQAA
jgi:AraC-like DNA-binding protein